MSPGRVVDLVVCAANLDHYRIAVQAGESVAADISFENALGDLDLALLDPSGAVVDLSSGTGDSEAVSASPTDAGVYTIRVEGKRPDDSNIHVLNVGATGCLDDLGENDDDAATARPLASSTPARGDICEGDEDWYAFSIDDVRLVEIDLGYDDAAGNLDVELRDASGAILLARSARLESPEDITQPRLQPGDYRVRVFSPDSAATRYSLKLTIADPVLLFVTKDPQDAILTWNDAEQECYTYRRSTDPSDFSAAVTATIQDGGETVEDLSHRDEGVIFDGVFLYCYLIDPSDCGSSLLGSTKTASPSPVLVAEPGTAPTIEYTITAVNSGIGDLFGIRLVDDLPRDAQGFEVLEIPVGAVDNSLPAPSGLFARGQVIIDQIAVPAGATAVVRFEIAVGPSGTSNSDGIVDNQGSLLLVDDLTNPVIAFPTDDPATQAFEDDTRVFVSGYTQGLIVTAFWHREVDFDLRVVDPCGNAISAQDAAAATCDGITGSLFMVHECGVAEVPDRSEAIAWWGRPPAGRYAVEIAYVATAGDDPRCGDRGDDDVTLVVQHPEGGVEWRTISVRSGTGFTPVFEFDR